MDDNKAKALAAALSQIEKQFGKGSIMRMGDGSIERDIQVVSTGSLGLDIALGLGGLPRGRVVEIYGPESSGKTTLTLQVIAEMQKLGGTAAFIDAEHALDAQYAQKLGVNLQELLISQPDTGEQALEIVDALVRSGIRRCWRGLYFQRNLITKHERQGSADLLAGFATLAQLLCFHTRQARRGRLWQ